MGEEKILQELLAFVREYENGAPLTHGITHLQLRELAKEVGLTELFEWLELAPSDPNDMKEVLVEWNHRVATLLAAVNEQLTVAPVAPEGLFERAVEKRLSDLLDELITASVERLPSTLHARSAEARMIRTRFAQLAQAQQQARSVILPLRRKLEGEVALLAHQFGSHQDTTDVEGRCNALLQGAQGAQTTLEQTQRESAAAVVELRELYTRAQPLFMQARETMAGIERLQAALRTLQLPVPNDIDIQMRRTNELLFTVVQETQVDFEDLSPLELDEALTVALCEIAALFARIREILNPIRPSVFARQLERTEEIRRLALIALCVYTDRPDPFHPTERHRGVGKRTVADVLVLTDHIDPTEAEATTEAVKFLHEQAGGQFAEVVKAGRFWLYRVTDAGIERSSEWLQDTLDREQLLREIHDAIEQRRKIAKTRTWEPSARGKAKAS